MIKDEDYITFLEYIIACISHGDYYSAKELSELELEKMNKNTNKEVNLNRNHIGKNKNKIYNSKKDEEVKI